MRVVADHRIRVIHVLVVNWLAYAEIIRLLLQVGVLRLTKIIAGVRSTHFSVRRQLRLAIIAFNIVGLVAIVILVVLLLFLVSHRLLFVCSVIAALLIELIEGTA